MPSLLARRLAYTPPVVLALCALAAPAPRLDVYAGDVSRAEMYRTFNMGVGMVVITDEASVPSIEASCASAHIATYRLGRIVRGTGQVIIS